MREGEFEGWIGGRLIEKGKSMYDKGWVSETATGTTRKLGDVN